MGGVSGGASPPAGAMDPGGVDDLLRVIERAGVSHSYPECKRLLELPGGVRIQNLRTLVEAERASPKEAGEPRAVVRVRRDEHPPFRQVVERGGKVAREPAEVSQGPSLKQEFVSEGLAPAVAVARRLSTPTH